MLLLQNDLTGLPIFDLDVKGIRVEKDKVLEDGKLSSGGILKCSFNQFKFFFFLKTFFF